MYKIITAIVRDELVTNIKLALESAGIEGMSFIPMKGEGEYVNTYSVDGCENHIKLEIYIGADKVETAINIILDKAHTGLIGDGIVAVSSVDQLYRIRTKTLLK